LFADAPAGGLEAQALIPGLGRFWLLWRSNFTRMALSRFFIPAQGRGDLGFTGELPALADGLSALRATVVFGSQAGVADLACRANWSKAPHWDEVGAGAG